jgi:hypothetical protein
MANAVRLTLDLAADLLGVRVPEAEAVGFGPGGVDPRVKAWARERIFQEEEHGPVLSPFFWDLFRRDTPRPRIVTLRKLLFPSPESLSQRYLSRGGVGRTGYHYLVRFRTRLTPYAKAVHGILARDRKLLSQIEREKRNLEMQEWLSSG